MKLRIPQFFKSFALRALTQSLAATLMPVHLLSQTNVAPPARHIIICVDGVGISTINKMRDEGRFKKFQPPSRMISAFPSLTNAAISEILEPAGAKMSAGYEDNYFDIGGNRMRGGIFDRLRGGRFIRGTFRELFDYHPSAIKSGLGYVAPPVSTYLESLSDIIRLRQKAKQSSQPVFFAYSGATDSLAHLGGEGLLRRFLKQLEESIEDIVRGSKVPVDVTVFSDHGNHFRKYRRVGLKNPLRQAGFNIDERIKDQKSVVFPQYGLVGAAILFTSASNEQRVASIVASVDGVDFVAFERNGVVSVVSHDGEATIEKRGATYRYQAVRGDPLDLLPVVAKLRKSSGSGLGSVAANEFDGFIDDSDWFAATCDGVRPDALRRIFEGATQGVVNRANLIVNLKDGYYTGNAMMDFVANIHATHGNIGQEQSFGFVISTRRELPAYIRAEDLWAALGAPRLARREMGQQKRSTN
ncbi:MAG: hypothetical protein AABN95_17775 [Acidobacteriota bacterium]